MKSNKQIKSLNFVDNLQVPVDIEMGTIKLSLEQLNQYNIGSVVELGLNFDTPVKLSMQGQAIAEGHLVNIDNKLGLEIDKILANNQKS